MSTPTVAALPTLEGQGREQAMAALNARDATLALLVARASGATVCPSEVARAIVEPASAEQAVLDWRAAMPTVHAAVDKLLADGLVQLSWKGKKLQTRAGPYRIGRVAPGM